MIRIVIGGDVCPMGRAEKAFIEGNPNDIFGDLISEIVGADLSIVNLESPLISRPSPIVKPGGAILGASPKCIKGFVASKWDVLNLANNHSFDHGAIGLRETIRTIRAAGLDVVGAGENLEEARAALVKEIARHRVVLYSVAEREYSVADDKTPGANPLDLIDFVSTIKRYKRDGIFVVLVHGGKEFYGYPSPETVRRCRFMVDMGADAVVCCHAHCPLPWEIYADRPIVYGLGNLVFESVHETDHTWCEGYLAQLTFEGGNVEFTAIPYWQCKEEVGARRMDKSAESDFLQRMVERGKDIGNSEFLVDNWKRHCLQEKDKYLSWLFGYNRVMRKLRRILLPMVHSREEVHRALLLAQCESHREVLNTIFNDEKNKMRSGQE